jgi:hypothetical protein
MPEMQKTLDDSKNLKRNLSKVQVLHHNIPLA